MCVCVCEYDVGISIIARRHSRWGRWRFNIQKTIAIATCFQFQFDEEKKIRWHYILILQTNDRTCFYAIFLAHGIFNKCMRFYIANSYTYMAMEAAWYTKRKYEKHNNLIWDNFKSQMLKSNKIHSCLLLSLVLLLSFSLALFPLL